MPFYEYQCAACDTHVEILQKISDAPLRKCPNCGRQKLKRLISAPVFRLKGGGWYETDFKSDKESKRNLAEHPEKETKETAAVDATVKAPETKPAETKEAAKPAEAKPDTAAGKTRSTAKLTRTAKVAKPARARPAPAKRKSARR